MPKRAPTKKAESTPPAEQPSPSLPQEEARESDPQQVTSDPEGRRVVYDKVEALEYSVSVPRGPLTPDDIVGIMGWEVEEDYQKRMVAANPSSKPEHFLYGDDYHCLDTRGRKVRCWNNANNRPFDQDWCEALCDGTILPGLWAGPLMMPGETINGETIRISKYGEVVSGQHQMTACKLADEKLQESRTKKGNAADPKYPAWNGKDRCVIETIVVTGISDNEKVLRTIDYVKPRTVADMLYTMEVFRHKQNAQGETVKTTSTERRELTRMLSSAIDLFWTRTETQGYRTHPEIVGLLERHKKLLKCTEHLFLLNKGQPPSGRRISKLRLSPGQCAALCYIMASSGSEDPEYGDIYRNESPPSEKNLDWSAWDKAFDFWSALAAHDAFQKVRVALGRLVDSDAYNEENQGLGGRVQEKFSVLAKAWARWKEHVGDLVESLPFEEEDLGPDGILTLSYVNTDSKGNELPNGQIRLIPEDDFGGIDCSTVLSKKVEREETMPPPPSMDEIEATKEEINRAKAQAQERRAMRK